MLNAAKNYAVKLLSPEGVDVSARMQSNAPFFDQLQNSFATINGAWLIHHGLPMPRALAESAFIFEINELTTLSS